MTKNITLSMPDRMAKQMEEMPEVNWSAVARGCIELYIAQRQNPDTSSLIEELQRQKGKDYMEGRRKAEEIARILGYSKLNVLMRKYRNEVRQVESQRRAGFVEPGEYLLSENEILQKLLDKKQLINEASAAFIQGLRERLQELENVLSKGP